MTPPALPPGWVATNAVDPDMIFWQSSNSGVPTPVADSLPNAAWVNDPALVSDKRLDSPAIAITSNIAQLTFRQNYAFEGTTAFFDGGVLEISIGGGAFQDIIAAGGSFVTGGYTGTISCSFSESAGRTSGVGRHLSWLYHDNGEPAACRGRAEHRAALAHGQRHQRLGFGLAGRQHGPLPARGLSSCFTNSHCYSHSNSYGHSYSYRDIHPDTNADSRSYCLRPQPRQRQLSRPRQRRLRLAAPSYTITNSAGTLVPGVTDIGNHCDDCGTLISLPFPVGLYGNTFTTATAGSNGYLALGTPYNFFYSGCLPESDFTNTIFPFAVDQITAATGNYGIFTTTTGTAPNRNFYIEWRACRYNGATTCLANSDANYEIVFHEGVLNSFDIIYGTFGSANATVGALGVEQNGTTYTQSQCNLGRPAASMQTYTLAPCGSPTPTPTATATTTSTPTPTPTAACSPVYAYTTGTGTFVSGTTNIGINCDDCGVTHPTAVSCHPIRPDFHIGDGRL